ncbi:MAG TPA: DUF456 domain-containing protein [Actinomycetota bacterium]|nr:DUF456 domain-containing protein [Actinomycetota bacterium]
MTSLELLVGLAILVGLAGIVIPVLPGLLLVWGAVVVWAIVGDGSDVARWIVAAVATAVAGTAAVLAAILPGRRAAAAGAPRSLMWVVALGTVVGFFVIPVVGALVGGPVAAYVAEYLRLRDGRAAWASAIGALKGFGIAVALQLLAGVVVALAWAVGVVAT